MKEDNAPTVTARRREPSAKQSLRRQIGSKKHDAAIFAKAKERAKAALDNVADEPPATDTLAQPELSTRKFKKRQINKSWLPTHLWHAKRARMTPPREPLWNFAIPLTPTEKSYRMTHRSSTLRGCVVWDTSYVSTIGVEGGETALLQVLRLTGVPEAQLSRTRGAKWRQGSRSWVGWVRETARHQAWITKASIVWCPFSDGVSVRKILVRCHPSAFSQIWDELLVCAKLQPPPITLEDLRYGVGSLEIAGPSALEALVGVLAPSKPASGESLAELARKRLDPAESTNGEEMPMESDNEEESSDESMDEGQGPAKSIDGEERPAEIADDEHEPEHDAVNILSKLAAVTDSYLVPTGAALPLSVPDPRLGVTLRTSERTSCASEDLVSLLSDWPLDSHLLRADLFSRQARMDAAKKQLTQKAINKRKGEVPPSTHPLASMTDPKLPLLLLAANHGKRGCSHGSWTLLLPWKCVLSVWHPLVNLGLASGGNPRFGGLDEIRQTHYEGGRPWFPADYPGTKAGWQWELMEREKRKADWQRKPKGKRIEWSSLDLGRGRVGEVGMGWACDWERLLGATSVGNPLVPDEDKSAALTEQPPPARFLPNPLSMSELDPRALTPVTIMLIGRGLPATCARIYRLPTNDPELRATWSALARQSLGVSSLRNRDQQAAMTSRQEALSEHDKVEAVATARAALATSLLEDPQATISHAVEANDPRYPVVPDATDLIGFVTTGNYNLGAGRGTAIGNIVIARAVALEKGAKLSIRKGLCIVREAGQLCGRIARWRVVCD